MQYLNMKAKEEEFLTEQEACDGSGFRKLNENLFGESFKAT